MERVKMVNRGRTPLKTAVFIPRHSRFGGGRFSAWKLGGFLLWFLMGAVLSPGEVAPAFITPSSVARRVTAYTLTSANDQPERDPRDWRLSGSADGGKTWTTLDARKGEVFAGRLEKRVFAIAHPAAFPMFRLDIDSVFAPRQANAMQVAEIELIGNLEGVGGTEAHRWLEQVVASAGSNPPNESADKGFDGVAGTKWLDYAASHPLTRASWVQWNYVSGDTLVLTNISQLVSLSEKVARSGCNVRIQAMVLGRNLKAGTVCLSDETNHLWVRLAADLSKVRGGQRVSIEGRSDYALAEQTIVAPRVTVLENLPTQPRHLRVGEPLAPLEDVLWVETEGTVRFVAQQDRDGVLDLEEGQGRMTTRVLGADSARLIRYLNQRIAVRGLCEPAFSERGERVAGGLWVADEREISLAQPTAAEWNAFPAYSIRAVTQAHARQPTKTLSRYALTSANDYPARDPRNWRLLGSNDGGKSWTTLDTRRDEAFESRFLRREFAISNRTPFNVYRLQIDSGNVPAVNSLQLAEIELEDPADAEAELEPLTERIVTALGEFPPTETKESAFDGNPKTKWLHTATNSWIQAQYVWVQVPSNRVIRLQGRLVAQEPGKSMVLEADGARLEVRSPQPTRLPLGPQVEAAGFLDQEDQTPVLTGAYFQSRRNPALAETTKPTTLTPVLTKVDQILGLGRNDQTRRLPVKIRGVVTCYLEGGDYRRDFKTIQDETGGIVLHWVWSEAVQPGDWVEVEGVVAPWASAPMLSPQVTRRLGRGTMPRPAHPSWDALRTGKPESQWIELRGVVRSVESDQFTLMVQGGQLPVRVWRAPTNALTRWVDATVAVRGVYRLVYSKAFQIQYFTLEAPGLEYVQVEKPAPLDPFGGRVQAITNLLQSDSGMELPHRAKIAGVVTYADKGTCYVQDRSGALQAELRHPVPLAPGDQVEVVGFPEPGGYAPVFAEALIRKISAAALPLPLQLTGLDMLSGEHHARRVRMAAVVLGQKVQASSQLLELQAEQRVFQALLATNHGLLPALPAGSRVDVTGVCLIGSGKPTGQAISSFELLVDSPADVTVLERPPWWNVRHVLWVAGLLLSGLLLGGARIWMVSRENRLLESTQTALREAHDELEVRVMERTAELAGTNAALQLEVADRQRTEEERDRFFALSVDMLCISGGDGFHRRVNPAFTRILGWTQAELLARPFPEFTHLEDRPALMERLRRAAAGQSLSDFEFRCLGKDGAYRWTSWTASPLDSNGLFYACGRDISERKQAQAQLEESLRQAGMAEVATSVLHNVGNVLNSVNTSMTVIEAQARVSQAPDILRVADLFDQHRADLTEFLTQDNRTDKVVRYLRTLAQHVASRQAALLEEIKDLTRNVDHIKDIVAMQQGYARAVGVIERVIVADLVNDALAMHTRALLQHDVQIVRDYDPRVPAIHVEKHKLLQILVNLIGNAKHACDESERGDKRLTLRLTSDAERVYLAVIDNGVGIAAENLTKIFQHGFTTRQQGHGFGLHSAALAAREMKGVLRVDSDGPGRGASFILELPCQPLEEGA